MTSHAGRHRRPHKTRSVITAGGSAVAAASAIIAFPAAAAQAAVSPLPSDPPVPPALTSTVIVPEVTPEVTVRDGDTLSGIAGKQCGNPADWTGIFTRNKDKVHNPDLIYPGQKLVIDCRSVPAVTDAVTVRKKPRHYASPAYRAPGSAVVSTAGMGGFQSCVIARESGGRTQVMNASGHYGLYQFSSSTWAAHGGNPADFGHASAAEQTRVFWQAVHDDGTSDWSPYDGC